ncbi:hypothetical protein NHH73_25105 [Oxalobacteraceae bacterium OTU3CINTB1]|nr:hypothetical protein NHH73_25105 [Oxalobacteraceae bacterium OTU3CINTB1]
MSASISKQAQPGAPVADASLVVVALAAATHRAADLGKEDADRAQIMLFNVLLAAQIGGFVDADIILQLAARRRFTGLIDQLAAEVVERIGGPDKFFALLDLSTTPDDWNGFIQ